MDKIKSGSSLHTVFIGVGSNIGDRYKNILAAEKEINCMDSCQVVEISKIYETEPVGYLDQDNFLNCVFKIETSLKPDQLIKFLLEVEKILKRERVVRWGPRTIDLDILLFDDLVIFSEDLVIPHPRMHERMFVLKPLCDLTPYYVHPVLNERCYRIAEQLKSEKPAPLEWSPSGNLNS